MFGNDTTVTAFLELDIAVTSDTTTPIKWGSQNLVDWGATVSGSSGKHTWTHVTSNIQIIAGSFALGDTPVFQSQDVFRFDDSSLLLEFSSPGVWTVCMMFFQLFLLAGYLYAHLLANWLAPQRQAQVHLCLLAISVLALPIAPSSFNLPA